MADRRRGKGAARPDWLVWVVVAAVVVAASVVMAAVVIPAMTDEEAGPEPEGLTPEESWSRHCSSCHGINGQGAIGPRLGGGAVAAAYPDIEDQVAVIADGRGEMPPFEDSLTEDEILAVAEYSRDELSGVAPP